MENKITTREWLPLIGMTISAFIFNTSEFMPIGLLSDIAADFRMTEAQAGMLITIYAYVVMLMSLPLMIAASRYPLRKLLLATISLFAVSHVASAFATGFWTLLLSRIGVAFAHSIFWSVASPIAVRLVKGPFKALAMSMIVTKCILVGSHALLAPPLLTKMQEEMRTLQKIFHYLQHTDLEKKLFLVLTTVEDI